MRFENWPVLLDEFTTAAERRLFVWGEWDCCKAAAGAVNAITGIDFSSGHKPYRNRSEAYAVLKDVCGGGVEELAVKCLGQPLDYPLMAQRGDVCLVETDYGDALGWCIGAEIACAGPDGVTRLPLKSAKLAWRV